MAPPNLPKPIADRLIADLGAVFKDPEALAKYKSATKDVPDANPLIFKGLRGCSRTEQELEGRGGPGKIVVQQ